jgi:hypothetical protein
MSTTWDGKNAIVDPWAETWYPLDDTPYLYAEPIAQLWRCVNTKRVTMTESARVVFTETTGALFTLAAGAFPNGKNPAHIRQSQDRRTGARNLRGIQRLAINLLAPVVIGGLLYRWATGTLSNYTFVDEVTISKPVQQSSPVLWYDGIEDMREWFDKLNLLVEVTGVHEPITQDITYISFYTDKLVKTVQQTLERARVEGFNMQTIKFPLAFTAEGVAGAVYPYFAVDFRQSNMGVPYGTEPMSYANPAGRPQQYQVLGNIGYLLGGSIPYDESSPAVIYLNPRVKTTVIGLVSIKADAEPYPWVKTFTGDFVADGGYFSSYDDNWTRRYLSPTELIYYVAVGRGSGSFWYIPYATGFVTGLKTNYEVIYEGASIGDIQVNVTLGAFDPAQNRTPITIQTFGGESLAGVVSTSYNLPFDVKEIDYLIWKNPEKFEAGIRSDGQKIIRDRYTATETGELIRLNEGKSPVTDYEYSNRPAFTIRVRVT